MQGKPALNRCTTRMSCRWGVASTCISLRCILYVLHIMYIYIYIYLCIAYISSHSKGPEQDQLRSPFVPYVRNTRNVPYTILTRDLCLCCLLFDLPWHFFQAQSSQAVTSTWKLKDPGVSDWRKNFCFGAVISWTKWRNQSQGKVHMEWLWLECYTWNWKSMCCKNWQASHTGDAPG